MKKLFLITLSAAAIATSCSKEFMKKHSANFKLNGTAYTCNEDQITAEYYNSATKLQVQGYTGQASTMGFSLVIDLTKINQTVGIDSSSDGTYARLNNSAVQYHAIAGEWKITSYQEGKPESRHTEGTFSFVGVNQYDNADTLRVTDGHFYVNNY